MSGTQVSRFIGVVFNVEKGPKAWRSELVARVPMEESAESPGQ
jgi:hypothetical protein